MQISKSLKVTVEGKTSEVKALFDTGSSFTVMGYNTLKELFGEIQIKRLTKPKEALLLNGQKVTIDGYIDSEILIDDHLIEDRIYLSKDMIKEAVIRGIKVYLPDLIIGYLTMEGWGIELDLRKGEVIIRGGGFLLYS